MRDRAGHARCRAGRVRRDRGVHHGPPVVTAPKERVPKGRGAAWTEERGARNERRSDEGRQRLQAPRRRKEAENERRSDEGRQRLQAPRRRKEAENERRSDE